MGRQINTVSKQSYIQIRHIGKVKDNLTLEAKKLAVYAFVMTKVNYDNALLFRVPRIFIRKLQYLPNAAAHIVSGVWKYDHISYVLRHLHWLHL